MSVSLFERVRGWFGTATGDDEAGAGDVGGEDDSADDAVWSFIPSWQYGGLHAESGGLSRDEQEQALRQIQRQAEVIEDGLPEYEDPGSRKR